MPDITKEYIEKIERRRQQVLQVAHVLKRSDYKQFAMVLYQLADDVTALISAQTKEKD